MGPALLLTFFAMACFVTSFIKGAPLVQSEVLAIGKDSRTHDHENPEFTNYIQKLIKGWRVKDVMNQEGISQPKEGPQTDIQVNDAQRLTYRERSVRHAARCYSAWPRCFKKSKRKQKENRNQRTDNGEGSSTQNSN